MADYSHAALRGVLSKIKKNIPIPKFLHAIRVITWELMKTQTKLTKLEKKMAHKKKAHMKEKSCPIGMKPREMGKNEHRPVKEAVSRKGHSRGK